MEKSNNDINWAKVYDHYEVEMREIFKLIAKPQNESYAEMMLTFGKRYLNKNKIFCEIGFGAGLTLRKMAPFYKKVVGLDISPKNVELTSEELIKEGIMNVELYYSNIMVKEDRFKGAFDVITFIHGLEHFSITDYSGFFSTIKYYLKEGGVFTGALPYKLPFSYRICPHCSEKFELDGHLTSHDLSTIRTEFERNGMEIVFLSNFNRRYYLKAHGLLKYIYNKIKYYKNPDDFHGQIEFIVRIK